MHPGFDYLSESTDNSQRKQRELQAKQSPKRLLWTKLEALELPPRPFNVLQGAGLITLSDLVRRSEAELSVMKNLARERDSTPPSPGPAVPSHANCSRRPLGSGMARPNSPAVSSQRPTAS